MPKVKIAEGEVGQRIWREGGFELVPSTGKTGMGEAKAIKQNLWNMMMGGEMSLLAWETGVGVKALNYRASGV